MENNPSIFLTGDLAKDQTSVLKEIDPNRPKLVPILPPKASLSNCSSSSEKKKVNIFSLIKKDYFIEAPSSILYAENKASVHFKAKSLATIVTDNGREYSDHWTMNYCAGGEDIEGILVLDKGVLTFNATRNMGVISNNLKSNSKKSSRHSKEVPVKALGDLEVAMNGQDIIKCEIMAVPIPCVKHKHASDIVHILQISLSNHGGNTFDEQLDIKLNDMRINKIPYACVYFNIKPTCGDHGMNKESMTVLSQLHSKIQNIIQSNKAKTIPESIPEPFNLFKRDKVEVLQKTNLPYFEFLIRSFPSDQAQVLRTSSQFMTKTIQAKIAQLKQNASSLVKEFKIPSASVTRKQRLLITLHFSEESSIVTKSQLSQILSCMPPVYQMMEWKLLYSTSQHGTSFSNLMRRGASANPFIIISKDFEGNVLGAYGSSNLRYSQDYYGTPETFLFTFKKSEEIQDFQWSKKNDMFIFASEEGIMFGTGPFYGLWIGNDLTRGRTYPCATFDSESLCDSADFEIARLEMWGLVNSYSSYS